MSLLRHNAVSFATSQSPVMRDPRQPPPPSITPAGGAGPAVVRKRSAHHALLFGVSQNKRAIWSALAIAVLAIGAISGILFYTDLSWASVMDWIDELNPIAVLPLMALLPIAGFPIAIVYLVAGARFGPLGGGIVVAAITAVHLAGTYLITRTFLREPLKRFIQRRHVHLPEIPEDEQAAICLIAALVPGLPYVVRNYVLALADVKFRYYFWVCLPIYVVRSYVTILLGDMGNEPNRNKIILLVLIDAVKVAICAFVIWRLRVHHLKYHGHHDAEILPAADAVAPPSAATK
jgi:uncharacterized membrane protein YdjX (TVP38/TMEM64 family)